MNWKIIRIIDLYLGIPALLAARFLRSIAPRRIRQAAPPAGPRILLVKFWGNGNLFMMLPSVALLRRVYPGADLDLLTLTTNRDAAACLQAFNAVHTVDTRGYRSFLRSVVSLLGPLRRQDYDIIIDFEQFARFSALMIACIGGGTTIGFDTASQHRHTLFTRSIKYDNTVHVTRSYLSLAQAAGAGGHGRGVTTDHRRAFTSMLPGRDLAELIRIRPGTPLVIFHVGTSRNFRERRWPSSHFARLADLLAAHHDVQIVLTGLADEAALTAAVAEKVRFRDRVLDAGGKLDFREYCRLIALADLAVSADTAAVHIASAVGTPVAGLYGPNTPALYGPWGTDGVAFSANFRCSPCITNFNAKTHTCRHPDGKGACMRMIDPEDVYRGIRARYFSGTREDRGNRNGATTCAG